MSFRFQGSSECLVVLATAVSLQLARGQDADTLELMAAFFQVLGDNLGLYAVQLSNGGQCCCRSQDDGSNAVN